MHANMPESKVNRMIGKRHLIAFVLLVALTVFGVLNLDTVRLSAYESPAIYISPAYVHAWSAIGTNYTFSVLTDYDGSDVCGYEFKLTYNPNVLEGIEVVNGDLITEDNGTIMWKPGTFNNTAGTLSLTGNSFYFFDPPPPLVPGPGILANVTFTVVGYGISNISFVESETRLIGFRFNEEWEEYNIIDNYFPGLGHIEGSVFMHDACIGDITGPAGVPDGLVDMRDIAFAAIRFGAELGDPNYDPRADITGPTYLVPDGVIDMRDIALVAKLFGTSC